MPYSRAVGPLTVIALDEADGPHFDRREDALPEATPADWAAADGGIRPRSPRTAVVAALLELRDPARRRARSRWSTRASGRPARWPPSWAPVPGRLPAELAAAGIDPADVEAIVLTHLHDDHIGWAVPAATAVPERAG